MEADTPMDKFPRPLTGAERRLIRWMIADSVPDPRPWLDQLEKAVVAGTCRCGCASIDFHETPPGKGMTILADYVYGPENEPFGAFVFAFGDLLGGLEVYSFTDAPALLPSPEDLRPFG